MKDLELARMAFEAAEARMNKRWGFHAWSKLCSPEMAAKYAAIREKYSTEKDPQLKIKCLDNLAKGLKVIDGQISESNKPDDFYYLHTRVEGRNYYLVADQFDQQRVMTKVKGKDPVIFTMDEVVKVMEADQFADIKRIKQGFPGSTLTDVKFNYAEAVDDEIPF
mgnify:FL=1